MEKIKRWLFCVVVVILVLYSGWKYRSVSLRLREAEEILFRLRQEETELRASRTLEEKGNVEPESARDAPAPAAEEEYPLRRRG